MILGSQRGGEVRFAILCCSKFVHSYKMCRTVSDFWHLVAEERVRVFDKMFMGYFGASCSELSKILPFLVNPLKENSWLILVDLLLSTFKVSFVLDVGFCLM